jgi:hypothetical protein
MTANLCDVSGIDLLSHIPADPLFNTNRVHINNLALSARLPTVSGFREV